MAKTARRLTPVERPTEWTTAVAMLATAAILYSANRDVASLVATAAACLPVLVTAIVSWLRKRGEQAVDDIRDDVEE